MMPASHSRSSSSCVGAGGSLPPKSLTQQGDGQCRTCALQPHAGQCMLRPGLAVLEKLGMCGHPPSAWPCTCGGGEGPGAPGRSGRGSASDESMAAVLAGLPRIHSAIPGPRPNPRSFPQPNSPHFPWPLPTNKAGAAHLQCRPNSCPCRLRIRGPKRQAAGGASGAAGPRAGANRLQGAGAADGAGHAGRPLLCCRPAGLQLRGFQGLKILGLEPVLGRPQRLLHCLTSKGQSSNGGV